MAKLPPVTKNRKAVYAFEAATWHEVIKHTFALTRVFRQKDEGTAVRPKSSITICSHYLTFAEFVTMLNEMRFAVLSPETVKCFKTLSRDIDCSDGIVPIEL